MQSLSNTWLVEFARQIGFVSAFLGGVSAAFLVTLLSREIPKRSASLVMAAAMASAVAFIVALMASTAMLQYLHPDSPDSDSGLFVARMQAMTALSFFVGLLLLLASLGLSGWLRSRRMGLITGTIAGAGVLLVLSTLVRIG